jgi:hypothetical protein
MRRCTVAAMSEMASPLASPRLKPWPREVSRLARTAAFVEAMVELFLVDFCRRLSFRILHGILARTRVAQTNPLPSALTLVRVAVRDACIFYPTSVKCLQRSAAVTRMLRRRGLAARLVIGYQPMPVRWHAWVEVDGDIVWDRVAGIEFYEPVDRM